MKKLETKIEFKHATKYEQNRIKDSVQYANYKLEEKKARIKTELSELSQMIFFAEEVSNFLSYPYRIKRMKNLVSVFSIHGNSEISLAVITVSFTSEV